MLLAMLQAGRWWCPICAQDAPGGAMMMGFMMLFWAVVGIGVVWLIVRALSGGRQATPPAPSGTPEAILRLRYARGEIDEANYHRMLDELGR